MHAARPAARPARPFGARRSQAGVRPRLARSAPADAPATVAATPAAESEAAPNAALEPTPDAPPPLPASFTLTLPSPAVRAGLRISEIWDGSAPRIVVTAVADELAAAGIRPGLVLRSLPHPTRRGERWELTPGNAPLSRVRDLIRVARSVSLDIEFSAEPIPDEAIAAWVEAQARAAAEAAGDEGEGGEEEEDEEEGASAAPSLPDVDTAPPSYVPPPAAVEYEREARALAKRLSARAARNAAEDARDDTPLLVGAAVAFLGPAAAILGWAYFSGFLDSLASHQY